jgi:hypothetical protein
MSLNEWRSAPKVCAAKLVFPIGEQVTKDS